MSTQLVLASSSPYRKKLLKRLMIPFQCVAPDIDESAYPEEDIEHYIRRMTLFKATAVADQIEAPAIIIASDQSASFNGQIVGKPHTKDKAIEQLMSFSGNTVSFLTGVSVLNTETNTTDYKLAKYSVTFRQLERADVVRYIDKEQPLDCAGSFKCEGLGVSLFKAMEGDDPTSLEGLPLIATCELLRRAGLDPLA